MSARQDRRDGAEGGGRRRELLGDRSLLLLLDRVLVEAPASTITCVREFVLGVVESLDVGVVTDAVSRAEGRVTGEELFAELQ